MNSQHRQWQPIRLSPPSQGESAPEELSLDVEPLQDRVASAVGDVPALLAIAQQAGRSAPKPGDGRTARLWELLASVAAVDVAAARVMEPHLDAGAILSQAGTPESFTGSWGVYAAEAPGTRLAAEARPAEAEPGEAEPTGNAAGVQLNGSKPWC
jgi:hypothetical protein